MEQALYDISTAPPNAQRFKKNPRAFLSAYALEREEELVIIEMNVAEMIRRSLNPMLAMRAFTSVEGRDQMPEYLRRIQGT
jgi:hypothetical protein